MFPKPLRLSREELSKVIKYGIVIHSGLFTIKFLKNDSKVIKTAFVVSKKELRLSVDRNRSKRVVRMAFRKFLENFTVHGHIVFLLKKEVLETDFNTIVEQLKLDLNNFCI